MKSLKIARGAALALVAAASSAAFAAPGDTQQLTVTATVNGVCRLTSVPAMNFTLDPSVGTNQTATSNVVYQCTKGTAPATFTVGGDTATTGHAGNLLNGAATMPYAISWTAPSAQGSGLGASVTGVTVALTGTILGTDYVNAAAGSYTRTIDVVIAP